MLQQQMPHQGVLSITSVLPCQPMRYDRFHEYWTYIMASSSGTLYTGVTGDIFTRVQEHKLGLVEGFSKKYGCTRLVYYEGYDEVSRAIGREKQIKGWRRSKKIARIEKINPRWADLAEHWGAEMLFRGQPPQENSLNLHGRGRIPGVLRRRP